MPPHSDMKERTTVALVECKQHASSVGVVGSTKDQGQQRRASAGVAAVATAATAATAAGEGRVGVPLFGRAMVARDD